LVLSVAVALLGIVVVGLFLFLTYREKEAAKAQAIYKLETWIGHGLEGYSRFEGKGRMVPQAICDRDGKPLLSWRVAILPYIEQVTLYKRFKLDEPWDSPQNIQLLPDMPHQYESPKKNNKSGETYYQAFTGEGTAFPAPGKEPPLFEDCADRLLVVEAENGVPWTKPEDLPYDPLKPLPPLGGVFGEGQYFGVFGNKSARWFSHPPEELLHAHILGRK
jgi:hypothetical protein